MSNRLKLALASVSAAAMLIAPAATQAGLTVGATSVVSSAAVSLQGAVGSAVNVGDNATTGNIAIGGSQTSGTITVGVATQTGNVVIHGAVTGGANTLFNSVTTSSIAMGNALTSGTFTIGGASSTGTITIGQSTSAQTINIGNTNSIQTINIGAHATPANVITIGGAASGVTVGGTLAVTGNVTLSAREIKSINTGLTALAGGAQAGTALTKDINVVTTVATTADSVQLPVAVSGMEITIINRGANSLNVFGQTGDGINGGGANAAYAVAANVAVKCYATGAAAASVWECQKTAR